MKNIKKTIKQIPYIPGILLLLWLTACEPMEMEKPDIGEAPAAGFEVSRDPENENRLLITNTSTGDAFLYNWEFGDGSETTTKSLTETANAYYPFPGEYKISLTAFGRGGSAKATETVTITSTDTEICLDELYTNLTGGCDVDGGKTWVFAPSGPVNFGGPAATPTAWWSQTLESQDPCFKDDEYVFHLRNYVFENNSNGAMWGVNSEGEENVCVPQPADPVESTWRLYKRSSDGQLMLALSNEETIAWDDNQGTYEVVELTADRLHIRKTCCGGGADKPYRNYVLVPEGTEPGPEEPEEPQEPARPLEENNIAVDFEGGNNTTVKQEQWILEQVTAYEFPSANPDPDDLNSSANVFKYVRGNGRYENLQIHLGHKTDLTNRNVFRLKVYFPASNTYSENLTKTFAVKLQNREQGGNAWQTQHEIKHEVTATDEWVELTFDFSEVAEREDFDTIVIQPGGEDHTEAGTFYFDDFELLPAGE